MSSHPLPDPLTGRSILLVIAGGIAAFKSLELIRRLRERGVTVRAALTGAGSQFVTPLSVSALTGEKAFTDLFSLTDEAEMGHIQLSRAADLVVVAPATADIIGKLTGGLADDLASTLLLATDKDVLLAPAMNVRMWLHPAVQENMRHLAGRGVLVVGPNEGDMACGEYGPGRMAEPAEIVAAIDAYFQREDSRSPTGPLVGLRAVVTSGPTHEAIDPVRYIANRSSGRQGHAVAAALARRGAAVTLVSGPVALADPAGVAVVRVESAREMAAAVDAALPADIAVCAAAVADWRVADVGDQKMKKTQGGAPPNLSLTENPDILAGLAGRASGRPRLVIGFAAETQDVLAYARAKRQRKGCDWIVANDVSAGTGTFGGEANTVHLIREDGEESWPPMAKTAVADRLADAIATTAADWKRH